MKVLEIKELEDCFDGSFIKEILFDRAVNRDFIHYLGKAGEMEYFPDFGKPFYKVDSQGKFIIKGIEGNRTARLILYRKNLDESLSTLLKYIEKF